MRSIIVIAAIALTGCSSLQVELEHTSHPFAGPPFGPTSEEDSLNTVNVIARRQTGSVYAEMGLGYKTNDGGFHGPELTFTSRVGVMLWSRP